MHDERITRVTWLCMKRQSGVGYTAAQQARGGHLPPQHFCQYKPIIDESAFGTPRSAHHLLEFKHGTRPSSHPHTEKCNILHVCLHITRAQDHCAPRSTTLFVVMQQPKIADHSPTVRLRSTVLLIVRSRTEHILRHKSKTSHPASSYSTTSTRFDAGTK